MACLNILCAIIIWIFFLVRYFYLYVSHITNRTSNRAWDKIYINNQNLMYSKPKMFVSKLEDLPDEILIEICNYLCAIDVINAFGKLNSRLERTITQFRSDINLQYLTFTQFQRFSSNLLPSNAEYIVKLTLNACYSPGEISLFNKLIAQYKSLQEFLPSLQQIWLIHFSNNDIDILPKLLSIDKVIIDMDTQIPFLHSAQKLLDQYFFCTPNTIKELRLSDADEGIRLQHNIPLITCQYLEKLIISVSTLDDLILIFQRAPYLQKLHIEINVYSSDLPKQYATVEMMPKHIKDFQLWIKNKHLLIFDDLYNILINMSTIERLSLEIETNDIQYSRGYRWNELFSNLPHLSRLEMGLKVWIEGELTPIDVTPYFQTFANEYFDFCCYADTRVLFIDVIPYNFDGTTDVMTSPRASHAKATNMKLFQQRARRVHTLCLDGQHELTFINDWCKVIQRFPGIQVLDMVSINISDQIDNDFRESHQQFRLPNLKTLRYVRSTKCQVNLSFFLYLANNDLVAPRLRALTIMYGDLIYLCKHLPSNFSFPRFKELCLHGNGADGLISLKDIQLLLQFFPNLEHFWLHVQSSRVINRNAECIAEKFLGSLRNLISFRLSCEKDSLRLPVFNDRNACLRWIKRVCGLDNPEDIHITVGKKELAIWR